MVNNLNDRINCETGELNPPIGMAEAGRDGSDEAEGTAFTREFGRGFKAGRESTHQIERAEPSRGAPDADLESRIEQAIRHVYPDLSNLPTLMRVVAEAHAKSGHVVLLEALRRLAKTTRTFSIQLRDFADDKGNETALLHAAGESRSALVEAEAAIKQAEGL